MKLNISTSSLLFLSTAEGSLVACLNTISISVCEDGKMVTNAPASGSRLTFSSDQGSPAAPWMEARHTAAEYMKYMSEGRGLPPAIAADAPLSIPYRSCEGLKGGLGVLEPRTGVTVSARVRACRISNSSGGNLES